MSYDSTLYEDEYLFPHPPAPPDLSRQTSSERARLAEPIWFSGSLNDGEDGENDGSDDPLNLPPPPCPPELCRQTTQDRARQCDLIFDAYVEAMENLDMPNGIYGPLAGLKEKNIFNGQSDDNSYTSEVSKKIMKEITMTLPSQLEISPRAAMFVRFDEDKPQYLKALLVGVEGTPYANGMFLFDLHCPPSYPNTNCLCKHTTDGATRVHANNGPGGFSPNMHQSSGQVCLSLLGTWDGPGWEPNKSNVYQVLSSIMWMILGAEHPYYMEPGYGGWEGNIPSYHSPEVIEYDEEVKWATVEIAMRDMIRSPPEGFEEVVKTHFRLKRKNIIATVESWIKKGSDGLKSRIEGPFHDLKAELEGLLRSEDWRQEVEECQKEVEYIQLRIEFLERKVEAAGGGEEAAKKVPKAVERLRMGPELLRTAHEKLQHAQEKLMEAERTELEERMNKMGLGGEEKAGEEEEDDDF
jgi:ubiquitin-protein ligase